jgi:5-methylcytosine-specific restriction endonuclease McrA
MTRQSFASLSDKKLLSALRDLVKKEKQTTLTILLHLAEVDRRELYLGYGFSSLYDYCVGALNYSRSAAGRRISTARCIRRYPEIYDLLDSDEVSSSTIGLVAPILDDENHDLLLREIRGKSRRQVETIVAAYKPAIAFRDRVTPVRVAVLDVGQNAKNSRNSLIFNSRRGSNSPGGSAGATTGFASNPTAKWAAAELTASAAATSGSASGSAARRAATHAVGAAGSPQQERSSVATTLPARRTERGFLVQFLASGKLMAKLDEVKSLLSNKLPAGTFEEVFEAVIDEFLDRHGPAKRQQRREKRKNRSLKPQTASPKTIKNAAPTKQTRHILAAIRDKVYLRDDGRCTYVGKNGERCRSTRNLQIDHIKPFARGGSNKPPNLRLLCGKHNRLEAKRILGADVMNRYAKRV